MMKDLKFLNLFKKKSNINFMGRRSVLLPVRHLLLISSWWGP